MWQIHKQIAKMTDFRKLAAMVNVKKISRVAFTQLSLTLHYSKENFIISTNYIFDSYLLWFIVE